jgi:hypothetical protein
MPPGQRTRSRLPRCRGGGVATSRRWPNISGSGEVARAEGAPWKGTLPRRPDDVDLEAFESDERQRLEAAVARLSPDARRELIALIWVAQRPLLSFEAALRRARRVPPAAQPGYLMGIRLERYIADGNDR